MKQYIGSCVENPFDDIGTLTNVVENNAVEIGKRTFLKHCIITEEQKQDMAHFPDDYEFYRSKVWQSNPSYIYFYNHSAIEYFYS